MPHLVRGEERRPAPGLDGQKIHVERRTVEAGRQIRTIRQGQDRYVLVPKQPGRPPLPEREHDRRGRDQQEAVQVQVDGGRVQRREALRAEGEGLVPRGQDAELVRLDRLGEKRRPGAGEEVQQATVAVQRVRRLENERWSRLRGIHSAAQVGGEQLLGLGSKFPDEGGPRVGRVVPRHELLRLLVGVRAPGPRLGGRRSRADVGDLEDELVGVHVQEARRGQFEEEQFEPADRAEEEVDLETEGIGDPREGDDNDRRAHRRPTRNQVPRLDTVASGKHGASAE